MIFKKGDPSDCQNYRPICLVATAYKVYAILLKQRLLEAGLDERLWQSQFGFRPKRATEDAIYTARRRIELALAQRNGQLSLLALDWAKAFDSVNVDSMLDALRRFGVPANFIGCIESLMRNRHFYVRDCGACSSERPQLSGITQGCTLSPLVFIVVMSALMHDAVSMLSQPAREAYRKGDLADLAFADDTLLLGVSPAYVTEFLGAVSAAGQRYGMSLHYGKL